MSVAAIIGAISAVAAAIGGVVYLVKALMYLFTKSPEAKKEAVDQTNNDLQRQIEKDGRPH